MESPDLAEAMRLLDDAKKSGFVFARTEPGEDGPLWGTRATPKWVDSIHLCGFSGGCSASRLARPGLVPEGALVERQVQGSAVDVLREVLGWTV